MRTPARFSLFAAGLIFAGSVFLHTSLVKAEPAFDATIVQSPAEVRFWFSERPEAALTSAALMKEDHSPVATVRMKETDDSLVVAGPVPVKLEPGRYMVMWKSGSKDGHVVRGTYYFTFDPAAEAKP
jgi:methionine-rich copper-binding protein CopC